MGLRGRSGRVARTGNEPGAADVEGRLAGHIPHEQARAALGRLRTSAGASVPAGLGGRASLAVAVDLRTTMANAAAQATASVRRRIRRTVAVVLAAILSLGSMVLPAAALVVTPNPNFGGFEVDGNLNEEALVSGTIDWSNSGAIPIADDLIDSAFQGSSKELDPTDWVCQSKAGGVTPGKDNLLRAYVNTRIVAANSAYLDLAFIRQEGEGDTHINFEFNKSGVVADYAEGPCGITRAVGDLLFTYDFGGTSSPISTVRVWRWSGSDWIDLALPVNAAAATNNATAITDPLNGGATIPARAFGELSVDLTKIPGFAPSCPGLGFVNIRSRSSGSSFDSALQDKMPTTKVDLSNCGSIKLKKVDDKGAPLAGATFGLYANATTTTTLATCLTGADGVCSFPTVAPGTYAIREISAPPGYTPSPTPITVTVGFKQAVDLTGTPIGNPLILGSLQIVKTNEADGKPVAGIRFFLLQGSPLAPAKNRDGASAECTTGADGKCTIAKLVPGSYTLREDASTVPATMTAVADRTVVITGGTTPLVVDVVDPVKPLGISLSKKVNGLDRVTIHSGTLVTYTLSATNTGEVPIDVTSLTDNQVLDLPDACDTVVAAKTFIAVGATQDLCTYTANPTKDVTNVAKVVGTDAFNRTANATADAEVDVINPTITLVKTVNDKESITVSPATPLLYKIVVTNTGDTDLMVTSFTDVETPGGAVASLSLVDCPQSGATLIPGQKVTCTYSATAPLGGVTDTAEVKAVDVLGLEVKAADTAIVNVLSPGISLTKTVNGLEEATVHEGDNLVYVVTVTNTGNAAIELTEFGDVVNGGSATVPGNCATLVSSSLLGAGGSRSCTYSVAAGSSQRANTASVKAIEPILKTPLTASDTALAKVIRPLIDIEKTVAPTLAHAGDAVTYKLVITNTGTTDLTLTALTDKLGDAAAKNILTACGFSTSTMLAVKASIECTYAGVAGADDTKNVAEVTAVDFLGGAKGTVSDTDDAVVDVIHPAITLTKDASAPVVHAGDSVTYTVQFKNTGDTPLTLTSLTDKVNAAAASSILTSCGFSTSTVLLPTEVHTCTYVVKTGTVDLLNTATVAAIDIVGGDKGRVTATDDAAVEVLNPSITIDKTATPLVVRPNQPVTYSLVITNTGDTSLTISSLTDLANGSSVALSAECLGLVGDVLAIGASVDCDYVVSAGKDDIHNVATVVAVDQLARAVTDDDPADVEVIVPVIEVIKDADKALVHAGDLITYSVTVKNTGDTPLRLTSLTDAVNGASPATDILSTCKLSTETVLQPGASTPVCTYTAVAGTIDLLNVVKVSAIDKLDGTVTDDDSAFVDVLNPIITIDKTVDKPLGHAGDSVTYTLVVTNTGDTDLVITSLDDAVNAAPATSLTSCGIIGTTLEPKAKVTCSYTVVLGTSDVTNVASVAGEDILKKRVTDTDDAFVDVLNPAITIVKSVDKPVVHSGDTVTYSLVITNTGDADLTITALIDAVNGAAATSLTSCGLIGDLLPAGDSANCSYTTKVGAVDLTNVAKVTGVDKLQKEVSDDDDAVVNVLNPGIDIVKSVDKPLVHAGDTVTYTLRITNIGTAALTITALDDAVNGAPAASLTNCGIIGTVLAVGASVTCSYTAVAGTTDLVNVATVKGEDVLKKTVVDDDDAVVDVLNPAIRIVKTANVSSIVGTSGPVVFQYLVTNTGDAVLTDIAVTDDVLGVIGTIARLAPGESATLTRAATVADTRPENIGKATGKDELGKVVESTDNELITFVQDAIIVRPAPIPPAIPIPLTLPRTGSGTDRQVQVALFLIVLGGMAVLPERIRRRRRLV